MLNEPPDTTNITVAAGDVSLQGILTLPPGAQGMVVFAHGSGSGRLSPRNGHVARALERAGIGTLLVDLLTVEEERVDLRTGHLRFDIDFLANRLLHTTDWVTSATETSGLVVGYFGASTGAAAALQAAAQRADIVRAVVSRGGRPDLAMTWLARVRAPTLLIVGGEDAAVIPLNRQAYAALPGEHDRDHELAIVPGAGHLFEEPGMLDVVATHAARWFTRYLVTPPESKGA